MNIAEVERLTGITKQNIRYYEKEGLIFPKRNKLNSYREYTTENIRQLKLIRILRKAGMSLEDIKKVLDEKISFSDAIQIQRQKVEKERNELTSVLSLCDKLKTQSMEYIDVDYYLNWIQEEETNGHALYRLWEDYRDVAIAQEMKTFTFMPDDMITTPQEFTDQLLRYAREQNADITITKESMYPEFVYNGLEYSAYRVHRRYGAVVHCKMLHPELAEPQHINPKRKKILKAIRLLLPILFFIIYFGVVFFSGYSDEDSTFGGLFAIGALVVVILASWLPYMKIRN